MSPEEKARRERQRMLDKATEYRASTYCTKFVAPLFQRMIRAEYGAKTDLFALAVVNRQVTEIPRYRGECVCITCGAVHAWDSGIKGMHTGHFIASRRNSILFEERNTAPQCSGCNVYGNGKPLEFRIWMEHVHGEEAIAALQLMKTWSVSFIREELVDMRITYKRRLDAAVKAMKTEEAF